MANMLLSSKSAYTRLYHTIRLLRFTLKASISSTCSSLCTFAHYQMWHVHTNVCRFNFLLERAQNKFRYLLFLKIHFDFIFWSLLRIKKVSSFPICVIQNSNRLWHEFFMARKYLWKNRLKNKWTLPSINLGNILASIKISQLDRIPVKLFICFSFSSKNKNLVCVEVLQVGCCRCYFFK